ncbi:PD-(D/E)XK nuclease superfamily protein [Vibrio parahaemolyticus]|uniref:PD-(D/E)XK nuclease superfamily protein n=1 Tax=Vibrio parahaemolyticus TaxID=670 RepID=UPI00155E12AF|nr:PD-(D/E)XK nuclease superfamily protein [Vibrio parahaemolyticus]MDG2744336.1 hypothetical protein [Vibrio parahaemolyticus]NMT51354.1 hypothetical protein [Vibrio parahaemolyticus]
MARADLLSDITNIVEGYGFLQSNDQTPFTYQRSVRYLSLIDEKNDTAHFVLHTTTERIQITAKWQEVGGTAIEKLGYTVLDAGRTAYDRYWVVCGGDELVTRAIDFLNGQVAQAPKLFAMEVHTLEDLLSEITADELA